MAKLTALMFDVSPAETRSEPAPVAQPIPLSPPDVPDVLKMFRAWLLETPHDFQARVRLPAEVKGKKGELQLEVRWLAAGDTVGVAF